MPIVWLIIIVIIIIIIIVNIIIVRILPPWTTFQRFNSEFLATRASAHLLLHSRNNSSRKEVARMRNEVHFQLIETPKREVTSHD